MINRKNISKKAISTCIPAGKLNGRTFELSEFATALGLLETELEGTGSGLSVTGTSASLVAVTDGVVVELFEDPGFFLVATGAVVVAAGDEALVVGAASTGGVEIWKVPVAGFP